MSGYGTALNLCVTILCLFFFSFPMCEVEILCVVSFLGLVGSFLCACVHFKFKSGFL